MTGTARGRLLRDSGKPIQSFGAQGAGGHSGSGGARGQVRGAREGGDTGMPVADSW